MDKMMEKLVLVTVVPKPTMNKLLRLILKKTREKGVRRCKRETRD